MRQAGFKLLWKNPKYKSEKERKEIKLQRSIYFSTFVITLWLNTKDNDPYRDVITMQQFMEDYPQFLILNVEEQRKLLCFRNVVLFCKRLTTLFDCKEVVMDLIPRVSEGRAYTTGGGAGNSTKRRYEIFEKETGKLTRMRQAMSERRQQEEEEQGEGDSSGRPDSPMEDRHIESEGLLLLLQQFDTLQNEEQLKDLIKQEGLGAPGAGGGADHSHCVHAHGEQEQLPLHPGLPVPVPVPIPGGGLSPAQVPGPGGQGDPGEGSDRSPRPRRHCSSRKLSAHDHCHWDWDWDWDYWRVAGGGAEGPDDPHIRGECGAGAPPVHAHPPPERWPLPPPAGAAVTHPAPGAGYPAVPVL